jgi:hypothetical protein
MHTSRAALYGLLDEIHTSLTLTTLFRTATVRGNKFRIVA